MKFRYGQEHFPRLCQSKFPAASWAVGYGPKPAPVRDWQPTFATNRRTDCADLSGAICPAHDTGAARVMPHANTQAIHENGGAKVCHGGGNPRPAGGHAGDHSIDAKADPVPDLSGQILQ